MLSFKVTVCAVVTSFTFGCDRHDTRVTPDTTTTTTPTPAAAGTSALGATDPTAMGGTTASGAAVGANSATAANPEANAAAEPLSDKQIAEITETANEGEIDQAKVAQGKAHNARVKAFATKMITHHGQAKEKQDKLDIGTDDSPLSKRMEDEGAATLTFLKSTPAGADFDSAYMKSQVEGHQKVLDAINEKLLPAVKDAKLAAYVKEIKPTVEMHLKEAKEIEQSLGAVKPAAMGGAAGAGSPTRQ